jgi:hypothetical protein
MCYSISTLGPSLDIPFDEFGVRVRIPDMFRFSGIHDTSSHKHLQVERILDNQHLGGIPILEPRSSITTLAVQTVFLLGVRDTGGGINADMVENA